MKKADLKDLQSDHEFWKNVTTFFQKHAPKRDFVANTEATSVDGSQECDILPEPACRELPDDTKVN